MPNPPARPNHPRAQARSVARARLATQEMHGIEPENRAPITKDEALRETAPIWRALPGQREGEVRKVAERFEKMFGPDFPEAFTYALSAHTEDQAVKKAAASAIRKWLKGQPVGLTEARQADQQTEVAATEAAVNARASSAETAEAVRMGAGPFIPSDFAAKPAEAQLPPPSPPARAITFLRHNPQTADKFDAEYGKGMAEQILKSYPVGGNQTKGAGIFPPPQVP